MIKDLLFAKNGDVVEDGYYAYKIHNDNILLIRVPNDSDIRIQPFVTAISGKCFSYMNQDELKVSGGRGLRSLFDAFKRCNCRKIDLSNLDISNVSDMTHTFFACRFLESINFGNIDTSNVLSFSGTFEYCKNLREVDMSSIDTSSVAVTEDMFSQSGITSFDLGVFHSGSLTHCSKMFDECLHLSEVSFDGFNSSHIVDISDMFRHCNSLESVDLSALDLSSCRDMHGLFQCCNGLKTVNLSNSTTKKVTDISAMFHACESLIGVDFSNFNSSKVKNMSAMFSKCDSLRNIDILNFDLSSLVNCGEMFTNCYSLEKVRLEYDIFFQRSTFDNMFYRCPDDFVLEGKSKYNRRISYYLEA